MTSLERRVLVWACKGVELDVHQQTQIWKPGTLLDGVGRLLHLSAVKKQKTGRVA